MNSQNTDVVNTGYLLAVVIPIVGFVIGIRAATNRDDPRQKTHGPYIIITSVLAALVWVAVLL